MEESDYICIDEHVFSNEPFNDSIDPFLLALLIMSMVTVFSFFFFGEYVNGDNPKIKTTPLNYLLRMVFVFRIFLGK